MTAARPTYRDQYKSAEQAYMLMRDQYSEVARALGFDGEGYWGDPMATHEEIVERATALKAAA